VIQHHGHSGSNQKSAWFFTGAFSGIAEVLSWTVRDGENTPFSTTVVTRRVFPPRHNRHLAFTDTFKLDAWPFQTSPGTRPSNAPP
jgi:hypothetical protein